MDWHVKQSTHNYDSNRYLAQENPRYRDWEVTTLFYSVVHIVDSYLANYNKKPRAHCQRKKFVRLTLCEIYDDYCCLESLSRKARYDSPSQTLTSDEIDEAMKLHTTLVTYIRSKLQQTSV